MALPLSVQKQADEAEALAKQLAGEQEQPAQQAPVTEKTEQGEGTQPGAQHQQTQPNEWEQKYRTLQGIFNAEQEKMQRTAASQADQIAALQKQIEEVKAANAQPPVQFGTDEDRATFGEDFVALVERGVQARTQEYRKQIEELKAQVATLNGSLQKVGQDAEISRRSSFFADLDHLVPGWREQNTDQGFLAWLNEVDPVSGVLRSNLLRRFDAELNSMQVASIFNAYRAQTGSAPQARKAPTLAQQVSPTRGHSTATAKAQKVYTQAEISRFYDDWRRGRYSEADGKAVEKDIEQAVAEGRVI